MAGAGLARFRLPGAARRTAAPAPPPPASERLPLLAEAFTRLQAQPRRVIMEFAPASSHSLPVFNDLACRLQLADFAALQRLLASAEGPEHFRSLLDSALIQDPGHASQLVLCWDYLNYLPRGPISLLMEALRSRLAPGARVHALIAYSAPQMPAQPCHYTLNGADSVLIQPDLQATIDAPRYAPNDLLRCMPGYDIDKAMLLKNGYQEYLFRRKAEAGD